jgi:nucleoside-diphosphate-sugar epimerase
LKILITGGAGYIGSLLSGECLRRRDEVIVVDRLLFGGESVVSYLPDPNFSFHRADVATDDISGLFRGVEAVIHLAALVGFPACRDAGEDVSYRYNTESTKRIFMMAEKAGVERFILASTYSNYGIAQDSAPVNEESPLFPQSLYAQTKIAAERFLLERAAAGSSLAPIIPRFTTLFGVSPRTRFDLIVNQFVLEALTQHRLVLYEGNYTRAFVHVRDVVKALLLMLVAPIDVVRGQIFNVGSASANHTKADMVTMVCAATPDVEVERRDLSFGSDMRDVAVDCTKIRRVLGFTAGTRVADGIVEVRDAIALGLISEPTSARYRNHTFIVH